MTLEWIITHTKKALLQWKGGSTVTSHPHYRRLQQPWISLEIKFTTTPHQMTIRFPRNSTLASFLSDQRNLWLCVESNHFFQKEIVMGLQQYLAWSSRTSLGYSLSNEHWSDTSNLIFIFCGDPGKSNNSLPPTVQYRAGGLVATKLLHPWAPRSCSVEEGWNSCRPSTVEGRVGGNSTTPLHCSRGPFSSYPILYSRGEVGCGKHLSSQRDVWDAWLEEFEMKN